MKSFFKFVKNVFSKNTPSAHFPPSKVVIPSEKIFSTDASPINTSRSPLLFNHKAKIYGDVQVSNNPPVIRGNARNLYNNNTRAPSTPKPAPTRPPVHNHRYGDEFKASHEEMYPGQAVNNMTQSMLMSAVNQDVAERSSNRNLECSVPTPSPEPSPPPSYRYCHSPSPSPEPSPSPSSFDSGGSDTYSW